MSDSDSDTIHGSSRTLLSPSEWKSIDNWDDTQSWNYVIRHRGLLRFLITEEGISPLNASFLQPSELSSAIANKAPLAVRGLVMQLHAFLVAKRARGLESRRPASSQRGQMQEEYNITPRNPLPVMKGSAIQFLQDFHYYIIMENIPARGLLPTLLQCAPRRPRSSYPRLHQ